MANVNSATQTHPLWPSLIPQSRRILCGQAQFRNPNTSFVAKLNSAIQTHPLWPSSIPQPRRILCGTAQFRNPDASFVAKLNSAIQTHLLWQSSIIQPRRVLCGKESCVKVKSVVRGQDCFGSQLCNKSMSGVRLFFLLSFGFYFSLRIFHFRDKNNLFFSSAFQERP